MEGEREGGRGGGVAILGVDGCYFVTLLHR